MEQIAIWDALRPRLWMIVAITVVATVAGYGFSFLLTEQYAATALVLVRPQQPIHLGTSKEDKEFLDFPMGSWGSVETPSKTYIEMIKTSAMAEKVVRALDLDKDKEDEGGRLTKLLPAFLKDAIDDLKQIVTDIPQLLSYGRLIKADPFASAVKTVEGNLSLKSLSETYVFEIKYTAKDSQRSAQVANKTADLFIEMMQEVAQFETKYRRDYLRPQLDQSEKVLQKARQELEDYKKSHSMFLYEAEHTAKLREIADLEVELAKTEQSLAGSKGSLTGLGMAKRRAELARFLDQRKAELIPLPEYEHDVKQLELNVEGALAAYRTFEKEFKEAEIRHSYAMPQVRLVSEAIPPRLPSSPRRDIITLAALLSGLVAGIGLAFALEYLQRGLRGIKDVEEFVGVKVLATIPRVPQNRWREAFL
jgi:uncharacterized protein involved in exopolysaccharide biosynthesis